MTLLSPVYTLPFARAGYPAGTTLTDVTLDEARAMECNRCGDCCDGTSDYVNQDPSGAEVPLFVWTRDADDEANAFPLPEDRYEERFGRPLIIPLVRGDGRLVEADDFERDQHGDPVRVFKCAELRRHEDGTTSCGIYDDRPSVRPYYCGAFPVFGMEADQAIIHGGEYIPHTAALPRCTWYRLRIVGPWKETPIWRRHHKENFE